MFTHRTEGGILLLFCPAISLFVLLLLVLPSCSGSGSDEVTSPLRVPFEVLSFDPDGNDEVYLNQPLRWVFSSQVDINSANFNSIHITVSDSLGNPLPEQVTGRFRLGRDPDGKLNPHVLEFEPRLPSDKSFSNGGFRASRVYQVKILLKGKSKQPVLKDRTGNPISPGSAHLNRSFRTVSGSTPRELFRDSKIGGPHVLSLEVGPRAGDRVSLNLIGTTPVEVKLTFDQPLSSSEKNVPLGQDSNPLRATSRKKGKIFLEYDDPIQGPRQWIRSQIELLVNDNEGAVILIRPEGVLPNNATVRVIVEASLQDLSGETNIKDRSYDRLVGTFETEQAFGPQFGALIMGFEDSNLLDLDAPVLDPIAEVRDGLLRSSFNFEGLPTLFDYTPAGREVILNTKMAIVKTSNGPDVRFVGGVFSFRDIWIKEGVKVQGQGSNPLVLLANGSVHVDGHISVDGGDGTNTLSLQPSRGVIAGGAGHCGGGNGGRASQETKGLTLRGESGWGPGQVKAGGGEGGMAACGSIMAFAAGGGGGSMAVQGDSKSGSSAIQATGRGGNGSGGQSFGGMAGATVFRDRDQKNDFWGRLVTDRLDVIIGELQAPMGGAGGGGGGDVIADCKPANPAASVSHRGGGGGGGGGILIIKALGPIIVNSKGRISADGGRGGGGGSLGTSRFGGGGGAGSGGMVVLMSATGIDLHTHQGTYANNDYNFSVTADGNISRAEHASVSRYTKYPPGLDKNNSGGYGGMGLIQLHTPPGSDADATGTILDDNVRVIQGVTSLTGSSKNAYLIRGDLRPDARFLPVTYGRFSSAELQWQTTGASVRRESMKPGTAGARVLDAKLGKSGPQWFFQNLIHGSKTGTDGYIQSSENGGFAGKPVRLPGGKTELQILKAESLGAIYHGRPAHVLYLPAGALPDPLEGGWSYANYVARLYDSKNSRLGEFRILSSRADKLLLDAESGQLPSRPIRADILAKFLVVETNGKEGLGPEFAWTVGSKTEHYPKANIQIGFAFHKDPSAPRISGDKDLDRFPEELGSFLYGLDFDDPAMMEQLRKRHYPFAKVRIRFNLNYSPKNPDTEAGPNPISPGMSRPAIRYLHLPYRF